MAACVVWYSTITIYVAVRGTVDIRSMLARLRWLQTQSHETQPARHEND